MKPRSGTQSRQCNFCRSVFEPSDTDENINNINYIIREYTNTDSGRGGENEIKRYRRTRASCSEVRDRRSVSAGTTMNSIIKIITGLVVVYRRHVSGYFRTSVCVRRLVFTRHFLRVAYTVYRLYRSHVFSSIFLVPDYGKTRPKKRSDVPFFPLSIVLIIVYDPPLRR